MISSKIIKIHESVKQELDNLKLCEDESYNSVIKRIINEKKSLYERIPTETSFKTPFLSSEKTNNGSS